MRKKSVWSTNTTFINGSLFLITFYKISMWPQIIAVVCIIFKLALHQYFLNMSSLQQYSDLLHLYVCYIVKCSIYVKITLYNYYQLILFYFISKTVYNPTKFYFKHIITFGVLRNVCLIVLMQKHKDTFSKQFSLLLDSLE